MHDLLDIRNLRISFDTRDGPIVAVDDVSLLVQRGKTTAIVGESGCGKSVTALAILRLLPQPPAHMHSGQALLSRDGAYRTAASIDAPRDLLCLPDTELRRVRGRDVAMVFQDPAGSLNPVYSIGEQITESIQLHRGLSPADARAEAVRLLDRVGIASPRTRLENYPHQLSGGMRQRAMIAMALAGDPALLIADEPTTALDVTVQAQILDLLRHLQESSGLSVLLITHDLGVVAELAHYVYVMYAGRIVEHASAADLLREPLHPYTAALLACTPRLNAERSELASIPGQVPDPRRRPSGCAFHPRCARTTTHAKQAGRASVRSVERESLVLTHCVQEVPDEPSGLPVLREVRPARFVACWEC